MALDQVDVDKLDEGKEPGKEMTFFDHIEELRWHLIRSVLAILVCGAVIFFQEEFVFNDVIFGPRYPDFITYRVFCQFSNFIGMGDSLCFYPTEFTILTPDLGERFLTHMKVSAILGFIISFPYIFWEIWRFIRPGLHEHEQQVTRYVVGVCSVLFMMGVLFGYFVISPFSISFLSGYQLPGVEVTPSLDSYMGYMTMFTLPIGMVFEMPVVAHVLTQVGVLSSNFMKQYRRHAIVIVFIIAAIITPPDAFSQILIAMPLVGLYEFSIFVAKRVEKKKAAAEAAEK